MGSHAWVKTDAERDDSGRFVWKCGTCGEECGSKDEPQEEEGFVTIADDLTLGREFPFIEYVSGWGEDRMPADCGTALIQRMMLT